MDLEHPTFSNPKMYYSIVLIFAFVVRVLKPLFVPKKEQ